jgi:predicted acylesterase/phospholipase RssA
VEPVVVRKQSSKTALVLAGGGLTGAVYEIGALRAINDLLLDRTINDFDIYVGTSAGALIAAFLANGVSPETMYQVIDGRHPRVKHVDRGQVFKLNWFDYARWGIRLPAKLLTAWIDYLIHIGDMTLVDLLWSLTEALPAGLYDSRGLEMFVREGLRQLNLPNQFTALDKKLFISATALDDGRREIFGTGYLESTISQAVAASAAFPLIYKPMRIGDQEYIDGGARGNASIDLAIEHGARLIVCINPLVPFDHHPNAEVDPASNNRPSLTNQGIQSIASQTFRIMLHAGLQYHIKQIKRAYPDVDVILIEPSQEDFYMFSYNIMKYSARLAVAQHGFETVTLKMAEDYPFYKETLARHNIPISRRLVIEELEQIAQSRHDPRVVRRILEATALEEKMRQHDKPIHRLSSTLDDLEMALEKLDFR